MILETLGSVVLGLALSWAALRSLSPRLPSRRTVFGAGALGALFGLYLMHSVLGPGHAAATMIGAALISAVTVSLLIRPRSRRINRSAAA
uniref:Integral membrane protein n=1 Tax=Streptomyces sp. NBC_00008 TaxID=2903610 RepID=A0AAU2VPA6_9ACTN